MGKAGLTQRVGGSEKVTSELSRDPGKPGMSCCQSETPKGSDVYMGSYCLCVSWLDLESLLGWTRGGQRAVKLARENEYELEPGCLSLYLTMVTFYD